MGTASVLVMPSVGPASTRPFPWRPTVRYGTRRLSRKPRNDPLSPLRRWHRIPARRYPTRLTLYSRCLPIFLGCTIMAPLWLANLCTPPTLGSSLPRRRPRRDLGQECPAPHGRWRPHRLHHRCSHPQCGDPRNGHGHGTRPLCLLVLRSRSNIPASASGYSGITRARCSRTQ